MDTVLSSQNRTQKRKNNPKNRIISVITANYISGYLIEIGFNDNTVKTVDFSRFLEKHVHPQFKKYKNPEIFKQFKIETGNLIWGENWDLIFPVDQLYAGKIKD
jgi:hypothetical protein